MTKYRCPNCGNSQFTLVVTQLVDIELFSDGDHEVIQSPHGDIEWGDDTVASCDTMACGWAGVLGDLVETIGPVIPASIQDGILTLPNGDTVNLLKIQAALNGAFQALGEEEYADASDEMSRLTGRVQGPHGEWMDRG